MSKSVDKLIDELYNQKYDLKMKIKEQTKIAARLRRVRDAAETEYEEAEGNLTAMEERMYELDDEIEEKEDN